MAGITAASRALIALMLASSCCLTACNQGKPADRESAAQELKSWGKNKKSEVDFKRLKITDGAGKECNETIMLKPMPADLKVVFDGKQLAGDCNALRQIALKTALASKVKSKMDGAFLVLPFGSTTAVVGNYSAIELPGETKKYFICGGDESPNRIRFAPDRTWLVDEASGAVSAGPELKCPRKNPTLTLMKDGKILISGGGGSTRSQSLDGAGGEEKLTPALEIYDPATNTVTDAGSLNIARDETSVVVLDNGLVIVAGGDHSRLPPGAKVDVEMKPLTAELFDPSTKKATMLGHLQNLTEINWVAPVGKNQALLLGNQWAMQFGTGSACKPAAELVEIAEP